MEEFLTTKLGSMDHVGWFLEFYVALGWKRPVKLIGEPTGFTGYLSYFFWEFAIARFRGVTSPMMEAT